MDELALTSPSDTSQLSGTKVGKFLANRGVIIIKEIKDIGIFKCDYGAKLHAETLILSTAKSSTRIGEKTFGIRLELVKDGETEDTAVLDFDESEEFSNAIQFIFEVAKKISDGRTDYIEATFSTKDSIQIGFYQTPEREQRAFVKLCPRGDSCFLNVDSLPSIKKLIEAARAHLVHKGAAQ